MLRTVLCALALLVLAVPAGFAAEQNANFSGVIRNAEGLGLGAVQVKVFVDGFIKGTGVSGADGSYDVTFRYEEFGDQTVVAWFIPEAGSVPEVVILRESEASRALGLWNPCLPRADLGSAVTFDPTIFDEKAKFAVLGERDCF